MRRARRLPILLAARSLLLAPLSAAGETPAQTVRPVSLSATAAQSVDGDPLRGVLADAHLHLDAQRFASATVARLTTGTGVEDIQFRLAFTTLFGESAWRIDVRHLASLGSESDWRYRLRVRLTSPLPLAGVTFRIHEEAFIDLSRRRYLRSGVAVGFGLELAGASLELLQLRQLEPGRPDGRSLLALVTVRSRR